MTTCPVNTSKQTDKSMTTTKQTQGKYEYLLPDNNLTIASGRVYRWLTEGDESIKPVSCVVAEMYNEEFGQFFKYVGEVLAQGAGINICLDTFKHYADRLREWQKDTRFAKIRYVTTKGFDNSDTEDYLKYQVADSLRLNKTSTKARFPNHISILDTLKVVFDYMINPIHELLVLDFSEVRDEDTVSSGKNSFIEVCLNVEQFVKDPTLTNFLEVLNAINATIRQGGKKLGAMTTDMKVPSMYASREQLETFMEYISIPFDALGFIKKGVSFADISLDGDRSTPCTANMLALLIEKQNKESLFFAKYLGHSQGIELRTNVCHGLSIIAYDQCLVSPANLAACEEYRDITQSIVQTTQFLCDVYEAQEASGHNLVDRQVAVGFCGLANCLRYFGVSYPAFISAMFIVNNLPNVISENLDLTQELDRAYMIAMSIKKGIIEATEIGVQRRMRALFAIEPNETCARRVKDVNGYDVVPNIDPPAVIPGFGVERRKSSIPITDYNGNVLGTDFNYGTDIFAAQDLTHEQHFDLWNEFLKLINYTGMSHGGCYEQWSTLTVNSFFKWWYSDIKHIYYNRTVNTEHMRKATNQVAVSARERMKNSTAKPPVQTADYMEITSPLTEIAKMSLQQTSRVLPKTNRDAASGKCSITDRNASECESCD